MNKKIIFIGLVIFILLFSLFFVRLFFSGDEDTWIKNEQGIWIKHGNPSYTPDYVLEQQSELENGK